MQGSQTHAKQIQRAIEKRVRQVISASEIKTSTRSGSKELAHLIKRLANQPIASLTTAAQLGEALGQQVIVVSQKMGRSHLDQGVIRQLVLLKRVPAWGAIEPDSSADMKIEAQPKAPLVEAAVVEEVSEPASEITQLAEDVVVPAVIELPPVPEVNETEAIVLDQDALDAADLDEEDLDEEDLDEEDLDEEDLDEADLDEEDLDEEDLDEEDLDEEGFDDEEDLNEADLDEEDLDEEDLAPESFHETEDLAEETPEELDEQTDDDSAIAADLNEISSPEVEATSEVESSDTAETEEIDAEAEEMALK